MIRTNRFWALLASAFCLWTVSAQAQSLEIPNTPRAVINGTTVGVWAEETSLGVCIVVAVKQGNSWVFPRSPLGCKDAGAIQNWPGGPAGYIDSLKEDISRQLASLYPPGANKPAITQINNELGKNFKLDTSKGSLALVRK